VKVRVIPALRGSHRGVGILAAFLLSTATPVFAQAPGVPAPAPATPQANAPAPASSAVWPSWLQVHAEHRTRYESVDARYRSTETGGDEHFEFRTRLQVRLSSAHAWAYGEAQDSRITFTDSASTIGISQVLNTHLLQLHAGVGWKDLGARKLSLQLEGGRFSRDFGFRRVLSRSIYRNTTNAFDGVIARVGGATWSVQGLATRPVLYSYPSLDRDPRFSRLRMGGVYATSTRVRQANADLYALVWRDGRAAPAAIRRELLTVGGRVFGQFGPERRAEYEVEAATQHGEVGGLDHRASFQHAQAGFNWPASAWRPRALLIWDYASGDADPTDAKSGAYDLLLGARRFEFGPMGLHGLLPRSNIISPGVWVIVRPAPPLETGLQVRGMWLAQARDRWRSTGLGSPDGTAGRHLGEQVEWRSRYRFTPHVELDTALTLFEEGRFATTLKPSPHGRSLHFYAGVEVRY